MTRTPHLVLVGLLAACGGATDGADDETDAPRLDCPDLSAPGLHTIEVEGEERTFGLRFPRNLGADAPVVFVWHGLGAAAATGELADQMIRGLDLQSWAREAGAIVVVPESRPTNLFGFQMMLWGILADETAAVDLAFYDALRGCVLQEVGGDPERVVSFGFSGGALWSSLLLMRRGPDFAAMVAASGGTGVGIAALDYVPPRAKVPVLLTDGGTSDVWPDPTLALIDFHAGTADLRENLAADGHVVGYCPHAAGHTITNLVWEETKRWLLAHRRGEASPYAGGGATLDASCTLATP